jgi:hypothetical protein
LYLAEERSNHGLLSSKQISEIARPGIQRLRRSHAQFLLAGLIVCFGALIRDLVVFYAVWNEPRRAVLKRRDLLVAQYDKAIKKTASSGLAS